LKEFLKLESGTSSWQANRGPAYSPLILNPPMLSAINGILNSLQLL
jgi:hypothetical protein